MIVRVEGVGGGIFGGIWDLGSEGKCTKAQGIYPTRSRIFHPCKRYEH